jgi:hypothetical protein
MSAAQPDWLITYFEQRERARTERVSSVLGELTERERGLIHDAAVMGYVLGSRHRHGDDIPKDSAIVAGVVNACLAHADLYPTLTGYESEPDDEEQLTP